MNQRIKKIARTIIGISATTFILTACSAGEKELMPYSSSDYENGKWTLEEIVDSLNELGFEDIEVKESKSRYVSEVEIEVQVEDYAKNTILTEYKDFKEGEPLYNWRKVKIYVTTPIPVLTEENRPELATILGKANGNDSDIELWKAFMKEHNGNYIEFDGTLTDVYDEAWYITGISLTICFEEHKDITFYWRGIEPNDIGYDNDYSYGCLPEGTPMHCVAKIVYDENGCYYEPDSITVGNR